jgi:thiol-disulfide isomerase/thioredoxin
VVFINFWASWCAPCKKEFPELNSIIERYDPSEFVVLAVNIDKKRAHADKFLRTINGLNTNLIVLYDPASTVIPLYKARAFTGLIRLYGRLPRAVA